LPTGLAALPLAVSFRLPPRVPLGLLVCGPAETPRPYWRALVVLLLDAVLLFEAMAFGLSFFSANCTAALYVLYLALLAGRQAFGAREAVIVVLLNLFFLLTY